MVNAAPSSTVLPLTSPFPCDIRLSRLGMPVNLCPWGLRAIRLHIATPPLRRSSQELNISNYTDLVARLSIESELADVSCTPVINVFPAGCSLRSNAERC
jgi:hypothetical protein